MNNEELITPVCLHFSSGERVYIFHQPKVVFGNPAIPENDIKLCCYDSNGNIASSTKCISRNHFAIICKNSNFVLENLSKSTGTWAANDRRIKGKVDILNNFKFDAANLLKFVCSIFPKEYSEIPYRTLVLNRVNNCSAESYVFIYNEIEIGSGENSTIQIPALSSGTKIKLFIADGNLWCTNSDNSTILKVNNSDLSNSQIIRISPGIELNVDGKISIEVKNIDGDTEISTPLIKEIDDVLGAEKKLNFETNIIWEEEELIENYIVLGKIQVKNCGETTGKNIKINIEQNNMEAVFRGSNTISTLEPEESYSLEFNATFYRPGKQFGAVVKISCTDEFGNKFSQDFKQPRIKVLSKQDIQQGIINVSGDYIGKEATQIKDVVMGRGASISQGKKKTKNGNKK